MDIWQVVFAVAMLALSCITGFLGWYARKIYDRVEKVETDLAEHRVVVARDYVPHTRLKETMDEVRDLLREIKESLLRKADK